MLAISTKNILDRKKANYLLNKKEALAGRTILASLPVALYVDINIDCNLKCPSCFRMDPRNAGVAWDTMDFDLFEQVAHALFPTAYKVNLSGGGESLFHKRFDEILELCLEYEVRPYLYSNGTPITAARAEALVRTGTSLGLSMDGATPETFERLRYPARWERMLEALAYVQEAQDRIRDTGFKSNIQIVVQKENLHELPMFVDLATEFDIPELVMTRFSVDFPEIADKLPDPEEVNLALVETYRRATEKGIYVFSPGYAGTPTAELAQQLALENRRLCERPPRGDSSWGPVVYGGPYVSYPEGASPSCGIPWSETFIRPDGQVTIGCCSGFIMGDLRETPFEQIWNSELYQGLRGTVNTDQPWKPCSKEVCSFRY